MASTLLAPARPAPGTREPAGLLREHARGRRPDRLLPVAPTLAALLPAAGLRRGSVLSVQGSAGLLLALLATASAGGAWCALVGLPAIGVLAASGLGADLDRLALVPEPGPAWLSVTAALVDTFDVVVLAPPAAAAPAEVRRLAARVRERGAVLVVDGEWPGAEVGLRARSARWEGLGRGHGCLSGYQLEVESYGRGAANRPRRALVRLAGEPASGPPLTPRGDPAGTTPDPRLTPRGDPAGTTPDPRLTPRGDPAGTTPDPRLTPRGDHAGATQELLHDHRRRPGRRPGRDPAA